MQAKPLLQLRWQKRSFDPSNSFSLLVLNYSIVGATCGWAIHACVGSFPGRLRLSVKCDNCRLEIELEGNRERARHSMAALNKFLGGQLRVESIVCCVLYTDQWSCVNPVKK